jgi:hypothetical protein
MNKEKGGTFKFAGIIAVPDKLGDEADELFHKRLKRLPCEKGQRRKKEKWKSSRKGGKFKTKKPIQDKREQFTL